jgi:hypothetical protein
MTVSLRAGDSLNLVPESHLPLLDESVRSVFRDVPGYFSRAATHAPVSCMKQWLTYLVSESHWQLNLHHAMYPDLTPGVAWFRWQSEMVLSAEFELSNGVGRSAGKSLIEDVFRWFREINWGGFQFPGNLYSPIPVLDVRGGQVRIGPSIDLTQTVAWGDYQLDYLIATSNNQGGWWSEDGEVRIIGTVQDTLEWVFGEFLCGKGAFFGNAPYSCS